MAVEVAPKTIYELELHDVVLIADDTIEVMRVASGWLYSDLIDNVTTFVPFSEDFRKRGKGKKNK